jgi:hypothetical protein
MSLTQKAIRATITLGDIELDCYQMPDGSYGYSFVWLANLIDRDKSILSDKKSPYYLDSLVRSAGGKGFTSQSTSVKGISKSKFKFVDSRTLMLILDSLVKLGHQNVLNLLTACAIESLERRADAAHKKVRTEQEYNERLEERQNHREDFHPKYTSWLKQDGCEGKQYAIEVNSFKRVLGLPIAPVDTYDSKQLRALDVAYIRYDTLRTTGMNHHQVLKTISV